MTSLPIPITHYDTAFRDNLPFFQDMRSLPKETKRAIMIDPTGRLANLEDFAQSHPTTYTLMRVVLMYEEYGQQVVVVGPRMQEAFSHTSLENIPAELIQLPHQGFYLATPQSERLEIWGGSRTKWHRVEGCYVAKEPTMNSLIIVAWGAANERSMVASDDATFWFRIDLDDWIRASRDADLEKEFDSTVTDDRIANHAMPGVEFESKMVELDMKGVDLDKAICRIIEDDASEASDPGMGIYNRRLGTDIAHVHKVKESARKLLRIVVNSILYMNSASSEVSETVSRDGERAKLQAELKRLKNPRKTQGRKIQKKIDELPKSHIVWVGPSIEREVGGDQDFTRTTGDRRRTGHIRRGHWHTFRVGPRKVDGAAIPAHQRASKIRWIPPLWVTGVTREQTGPRVYGLRNTIE